jgi:hypothetical protein
MKTVSYACQRLQSLIHEIDRLKESEFPYLDSQSALAILERLFRSKLTRLQQFVPESEPRIVARECALALRALFVYVPYLGFILRSTNQRNAFEVYRPLRRLVRDVLEPRTAEADRRTKLLLSSEWEYSPYVYSENQELPDFVLLGLPAQESSNPLLVPLAGHELGHRVWAKRGYETSLRSTMIQAIVTAISQRWSEYQGIFPQVVGITQADLTSSLYARETWLQAFRWALRQCEESFCDFVGLHLFGSSYLHAWAYLCSPNPTGKRTLIYPNLGVRARNLLTAAREYGLECPEDYENLFSDLASPSLDDPDAFRLKVADQVCDLLIPDLIGLADDVVTDAGILLPSQEEAERIYQRFLQIVPAENTHSLADIFNAGWLADQNPVLWQDLGRIHDDKDTILKELILKNCEVFEIEQILSETQ